MDFEQIAQLDLEDIELIRKGGAYLEKGISNLFKRHYQSYFSYYRRCGYDDGRAEELVQDSFVKVVRKIDTFRGDCPIGAWLWLIVKRTGYDKPPEHVSDPGDEMLEFLIGGEEDKDDSELINCIRGGYNQFAKQDNERAQVLTLIAFNGLSLSAVAQIIERTPGATREYISQCRKKLKPFIQHCLELLSVN